MNLLANQQSAKAHLHDWRVGALFMEAGTGKTGLRRIEDLRATVQMAGGTGKGHGATQLVNERSFVN